MEATIPISILNDFIFCPMSIYFHNLYSGEEILYQNLSQIEGKQAHKSIDTKTYSTKKSVLQGLEVFSHKYNLCGKIDIYYLEEKTLVERKRKISQIYDGYIFQLYAQYFCMLEMGYEIENLKLYSYENNKSYQVSLPKDDERMFNKFEALITSLNNFEPKNFVMTNGNKCKNCIYSPLCDRTAYDE